MLFWIFNDQIKFCSTNMTFETQYIEISIYLLTLLSQYIIVKIISISVLQGVQRIESFIRLILPWTVSLNNDMTSDLCWVTNKNLNPYFW